LHQGNGRYLGGGATAATTAHAPPHRTTVLVQCGGAWVVVVAVALHPSHSTGNGRHSDAISPRPPGCNGRYRVAILLCSWRGCNMHASRPEVFARPPRAASHLSVAPSTRHSRRRRVYRSSAQFRIAVSGRAHAFPPEARLCDKCTPAITRPSPGEWPGIGRVIAGHWPGNGRVMAV
jgi:hypothetical protein